MLTVINEFQHMKPHIESASEEIHTHTHTHTQHFGNKSLSMRNSYKMKNIINKTNTYSQLKIVTSQSVSLVFQGDCY